MRLSHAGLPLAHTLSQRVHVNLRAAALPIGHGGLVQAAARQAVANKVQLLASAASG